MGTALLGLECGTGVDAARAAGGLGAGEQVATAAWRDSSLGWRTSRVARTLPGTTLPAPGSLRAPDSGDQLRIAGGVALDLDDPLGGGGEGILAQRPWAWCRRGWRGPQR